MAEIPKITKMGLVKKYGKEIGSFVWNKMIKEGLGYGELHPSQVTKRIRDLAAKASEKTKKANYERRKEAGELRPKKVLLEPPVERVKPKTLRPTAGKEGMGRWTTEEDKIAGVEAAKSIAAKKAALAKVKKKGEKLKADRDIGMGRKKSSGSFVSPKVKKREESLKKRYTTKTAGKKVKLGKSRYHIKNPDSTKEVIYDWDAKKNKFVIKKGRPPKKDSTYEGERPPRTESGKLAKTDPAKKRVTKEQQLEKTGRGPSQAKKGRRVPPKKDPRTGKEIDYTAKGKGLKRPPAPKELPPSKKKQTKKTQPKHTGSGANLKFTKTKKKKEKDKPYNAGKKAGK